MGTPPTAKQWTLPSGLGEHTTLLLSYKMELCFNIAVLLMAVAVSLLLVMPAVLAAIYALPTHLAQNLATSAGACNSPAYLDSYRVTPFKMGQLVTGTVSWCDAQTDGCSISSFLNELSSSVYEQADPARRIDATRNYMSHDAPDTLPRCIANGSQPDVCPEVLLLMRNITTATEEGVLPLCVMEVLVECNQQAIVEALDWVPVGNLVPLSICVRRSTETMLALYSWHEPLEVLANCIRLMLALFTCSIAFTIMAIIGKKLLVGRFRSGTWNVWDVRSREWIKQSFGNNLAYLIMFADTTLSKALHGSQWQLVIYGFSGMHVGKRVFVDRDAVIMGAFRHMLQFRCAHTRSC